MNSYINIQFPLKDPVQIFFLVLCIILFIPILLKKFKAPGIVGLIIAGVIIGPHGFNVLAKDSSIDLFGTVGLLYIMFLAGLELDMGEFRKSRIKSIVFGILTFSVPFLIGTFICKELLHYPTISSILISSMFSTHTLVSYPIVSKLGINRSEPVTIAVGGTIITDTTVLIILAIITSISKGELNFIFWLRLVGLLIAFSIIVFAGFPFLAKRFFRSFESEKTSQFIFVLAMLFFSAFLSKLAGLEPIIGAFLAGLSFNRLIPSKSALMNRLQFVGNALFIPFFIISVGMLVDLKVLLQGPIAIFIALTLSITALLSKWLASFVTQKIFNYTTAQGNLIFGLSSSHAAATIAVILIGFNRGIVDVNVLNGTIILILITCLVSSFVTDKSAKRFIIEESKKDLKIDSSAEKILVPICNPLTMERLIDLALMIKETNTSEPIFPLAVVEDDSHAHIKYESSRRMLEKAAVQASAMEQKVEIITRIDNDIADRIKLTAKELNINHIIMGWPHKIEISESESKPQIVKVENILFNSTQMIWVARLHSPMNTIKKIIVAVPPFSIYEGGFKLLILKLKFLSKQLKAKLVFYGDTKIQKSITKILTEKSGSSLKSKKRTMDFRPFEEWENISIFKELITPDDLFVFVSARKGNVSHKPFLESVYNKIGEQFQNKNCMVVFPEVNTEIPFDDFNDSEEQIVPEVPNYLQLVDDFRKKIGKLIYSGKKEFSDKINNIF